MQLRDAAEMLGVHYQTAYAWVRQGVLPARKTGRGYDVSEGDISALAARRASGTAPRPNIRVRDWVAQADRLHAAVMSGDETMARHVFARLARGVPLTDLCERIIAPALQRVGDDWASGATSIGAGHRASCGSRRGPPWPARPRASGGSGDQAGGEGGDLVLLLGQVGRGGARDEPRRAARGVGGHVVGGHVDRSPAGVLQRGRVPARGPGRLEHQVDLGGPLGFGEPAAGEVAVAAQARAAGGGRTGAPDVDGQPAQRLGEAAQAGEGIERAVEADSVLV